MQHRRPRALVPLFLVLAIALATPGVPAVLASPAPRVTAATSPSGVASPDLEVRTRPSAEPTEAPRRTAAPAAGGGEALLVSIERDLLARRHPGGGQVVGTVPSHSRVTGEPIVAWVRRLARDGRVGLVTVPFLPGAPAGWIRLAGLRRTTTPVAIEADLSRREILVRRAGEVVFRAPAAVGAASSPTPTGSYFVTDRVPFPGGGPYGTFAFGISGIQPNLPPGWTGGDQLAIHGTDDPASIGDRASAGCLRVSERVLERLRPLLRLGTPVVIHA